MKQIGILIFQDPDPNSNRDLDIGLSIEPMLGSWYVKYKYLVAGHGAHFLAS